MGPPQMVPGATQRECSWTPGPQNEHRAQQGQQTGFNSHGNSGPLIRGCLECCAKRILRTNLDDELAMSAMNESR